jgi:Fic family protein
VHSLDSARLGALAFNAEQAATLRAVGECRGRQALFYQQAPETLSRLRQIAIIESAESSNRLEGVTVSPARLEPLILRRTDPRNRSEQELAGYRDALALIHESASDMPFTPNVVLQLHHTLYRYMPNPGGRWKSANNEIVEQRADGTTRVRFRPTPAHLVQAQMDELATRYRNPTESGRIEPLVLAPLAVFDFLCIHPFTDGNGRISRLLTWMLLYQHGYEVGRYISLERVIEDSKETYYDVLERSSQGWHDGQHDVMPWLNYFWGVLLRAYREFEERVGKVRDGRGAKTEQVRLAVLSKKNAFSISDIESECAGVSRDMVRHVLRRMKTEGLIAPTGRGRGAKWFMQNQENSAVGARPAGDTEEKRGKRQ